MTKAVLTGHSRGLGAALAAALLARGIATLGLARRDNAALAARYPQLLREVVLDLSDSAALRSWLDGGELHTWLAGAARVLLINNAGVVGPVGALDVQSPAQLARAVALNVSAPLMLAAAFAASNTAERRIVHISSGAARQPIAGWSFYCASKAALDQHARTVAADATPGVRICSLAPGVIDTDMQAAVRASDPARFPQHARFVAMHAEGALLAPAAVAERLLDYLLGDAFGAQAVADLRDL
ncbi:MAG: SDR family oxidoreductase [Metallibacterium scheffleri]|uniref:SDR family oxidoreductase n=1 Tax=Metallibacterium scheffleri TaxID=993689 RepID=UPI0026F0581E|nr:SDR family oxidoreductase [Metallibacterium scheffleri]MCK9367659.1 SDR family oxidoreductase [Metallibacterium scheffleri]